MIECITGAGHGLNGDCGARCIPDCIAGVDDHCGKSRVHRHVDYPATCGMAKRCGGYSLCVAFELYITMVEALMTYLAKSSVVPWRASHVQNCPRQDKSFVKFEVAETRDLRLSLVNQRCSNGEVGMKSDSARRCLLPDALHDECAGQAGS